MNRDETLRHVLDWIDTDRYDPMRGVPRIGECTADHYWWDDECWYTEDEKDQIQTNAWWAKRLPPLRPINQIKHEWGQSYNEEITP
jgi:hypothetical protein